ncbi:MAG TPA: hypothetical protein PLP42_11220 [Acidobacteriota bacterium]|nr:hypothetical protein [Acidobacteriota bacterium]
MGAFFLFTKHSNIDLPSTRQVFRDRGFNEPNVFDLNGATLWLFRKQLLEDNNYYFLNATTAIFAVGTPVYRGTTYLETLRGVLKDYVAGILDWNQLLGAFCLILFVNGRLHIINDRLHLQHVFYDEGGTRISSSFLAIIQSTKERLRLSRRAVYEKLMTGYVTGSETMIEGIHRWTSDEAPYREFGSNIRLLTVETGPSGYEPSSPGGFTECATHQVHTLRQYFAQIRANAQRYGCDIGLSGGYDSRLIYALACSLRLPVTAHTHATGHAHASEVQIAEELAQLHGVKLRIIPTRDILSQPEEALDSVLEENFNYFDGRCADNSGFFGETYTRWYRLAVQGSCKLGLNGLGGEIYRNYYCTPNRVRFPHWFTANVLYPGAQFVLNKRASRNEVIAAVLEKMGKRLDAKLTGKVDLLTVRRYYSEIRQPDCEGAVVNAHNQLSLYLTPFIEYQIIREAYSATPHLGPSGQFQSAMLELIDSDAARVSSHYGYPLIHQPASRLLIASVKRIVPDLFWILRRRSQVRHSATLTKDYERYQSLVARSRTLGEIHDTLQTFVPGIALPLCLRHSGQRRTTLFVGYFLKRFAERIS